MKKFFLSTAAVAAIAILGLAAVPANAEVVDLSGVNAQTANVRAGDTDQTAAAVDINWGHVADSVTETSATNLVNTVSDKIDVDQSAGLGFLNASFVNDQALNLSLGPVNQLAVAVTGEGALDRTTVSTDALNSVNLKSATITIKQ